MVQKFFVCCYELVYQYQYQFNFKIFKGSFLIKKGLHNYESHIQNKMPPFAPQKQKKSKKSKPHSNSNLNHESIDESFLIPTSTTKEDQKSNQIQRNQLTSISSNFYCLPIYYGKDQQTILNVYISTKARFPSNQSIEQENQVDDDQGGRTILMINLDYNLTIEEIKEFLGFNLNLQIDQIEVMIDRLNGRNLRVSFMERESEIQRLSQHLSQLAAAEVTKVKKKKEKKSGNQESVKPIINLPPLIIEKNENENENLMDRDSNRLLPNAYVRFKSSDQLRQLLSIDPSQLPLQWPTSSSSSEKKQASWLSRYRAQRKTLRPSYESVKAHTDAWMLGFDSGVIKPLSLITKGKNVKKGSEEEEEEEAKDEMKVDEDDGEGEWITVTRGGQHGRSSTIPTQPSQDSKGADPYAQSSMAGRDSSAGVKVMKRGFLEAFEKDSLELQNDPKRRGGELNTGFYRSNVNETKKIKMFEIRKKFDEDRARVERMRSSRKFKPY